MKYLGGWRFRGGYTLIEIMVTVAIVSVVAALISPLLTNMTSFWRLTQARAVIERDARVSMDLMNRAIRQAQSSTIVLSNYPQQPPYSAISFTDIKGNSVSFYQQGNYLYEKFNTTVSMLTKNLEFVSFTFPDSSDPGILSVAMTTQKSTYLGRSKALELSIEEVRVMN